MRQQLCLPQAPDYMFRLLKKLPKDRGFGWGVVGSLPNFPQFLMRAMLHLQKPSLRAQTGSLAETCHRQEWSQSLETPSQCSAISRALLKQTHLWMLPVWATAFLAYSSPHALHPTPVNHANKPKLFIKYILTFKSLKYFRVNIRDVLERNAVWAPDMVTPENYSGPVWPL